MNIYKKNSISFFIGCLFLTIVSCNSKDHAVKTARIYNDFLENSIRSELQDFSYAGYQYGEKNVPQNTIKVINVSEHGILPDTQEDLLHKIYIQSDLSFNFHVLYFMFYHLQIVIELI